MANKTETKKTKVIFVCTGNTCRSPMAEFMFKSYLRERGEKGVDVSSAGLYAERGAVMSENAHRALDLLGIKHTAKKARTFTVQMALDADYVIAMSERHAAECGDLDNLYSFEEFGPHLPVPDPYGGSLQDYMDCAARIRSCFDDIYALISRKN